MKKSTMLARNYATYFATALTGVAMICKKYTGTKKDKAKVAFAGIYLPIGAVLTTKYVDRVYPMIYGK